MPKITDTDRINFIQMLMQSKSYRHFQIQAIGPGNQMYSEESKLQIFTIPSQHQYGRTVRDVIDIAMKLYEERKGMFRRRKRVGAKSLRIGELEIITNEFWAKNPFGNKNAIISKLMEGNR